MYDEGWDGEVPVDLGGPGSLGKIQIGLGKRRKTDYKMPEKTYWHIYSLQTLNDEKFIKVVNKILKREYILIK